jgi:hypothetical protein
VIGSKRIILLTEMKENPFWRNEESDREEREGY